MRLRQLRLYEGRWKKFEHSPFESRDTREDFILGAVRKASYLCLYPWFPYSFYLVISLKTPFVSPH